MKRVGLTGGIGSGKSTAGKVFGLLGIPVFNADAEAKLLLTTNNFIRTELVALFGPAIYLPDDTINRKKLASIIFNDPSLLDRINKLVHPEVHRLFFEWGEKQKAPFVLYEAAILFEGGYYQHLDCTILAVANENTRVSRVMQRDLYTEWQVRQRMANQWGDEQKSKLADFIIHNNGTELVIPQVLEIYKTIMANG